MAEPAAPEREKSDNGLHPGGQARSALREAPRTQAVEAERAVVEEEADVARPRRHAAEGVGTAGRQRVDAAGEQEHHQRPGEGVSPCRLNQHHRHQFPQEVPAGGKSTEE